MSGLVTAIVIIVIAALVVWFMLRVDAPRDARRRDVSDARERIEFFETKFNRASDAIYSLEVKIRDNPTHDVVGDELRRALLEIINDYRNDDVPKRSK